MSASSQHDVVERIHASGRGCVVSLTGGGSQAIADLLTVPGASATMLEAVVPYSAAALAEWLGGKFDQACSEPTARAMAMAGFERARQLSDADPTTLRGIGATASLATTRPKRGPHRVHVAWQSAEATVSYSCELVKGKRTRAEEEALAAELVLHAVAEACGVASGPPHEPSAEEPVTRREKRAPRGMDGAPARRATERRSTASTARRELFFPARSTRCTPATAGWPNSRPSAAARPSRWSSRSPTSTSRRSTSSKSTIASRDCANYPVLLTRAATFVEKAALVPGAVFVVGADTIARIADEKYYDGDREKRDSAIAAIAARGCRFLVFGRVVDGRFLLPSELNLPSQLRELCDEVRESEFRQDVCSTELRAET